MSGKKKSRRKGDRLSFEEDPRERVDLEKGMRYIVTDAGHELPAVANPDESWETDGCGFASLPDNGWSTRSRGALSMGDDARSEEHTS